ncbi:MAG: NlpC/P60 family protein [Candidatus Angelobacter sp.]
MRTFSVHLFIVLAALIVWGTSKAAAQARELQIFRMHVADPEDQVWELPTNTEEARDFLLRLGLQLEHTDLDCSHFVHRLFERAGLPYAYGNSVEMYKGNVDDFRRVSKPQEGDLIVWQGHMGIVVDPQDRTFLSALRSGVKVADYDSHYWKKKGHARFFRYIEGREEQLNRQQSHRIHSSRRTHAPQAGNGTGN